MSKGIDTSKWQSSKVDYVEARKAGYEFVFLRIGCGSTKDVCFEKDYASAMAAGLRVGVYFYTYAENVTQAIQDATRVLGWLNNRKLDLPVAYDVEDAKQKGSGRRTTNSMMYNAFAERFKGKYQTMLYTGEHFFNSYFTSSLITDPLWIAKYSQNRPVVGRDIAIWQYTPDAYTRDFYKAKLDRNEMLIDMWGGSKPVSAVANSYPVPTRTLKKAIPMMKGNDVKWLQFELGMPAKEQDGYFGNGTKNAVIAYQRRMGLKADGIVGPATRYSLLND